MKPSILFCILIMILAGCAVQTAPPLPEMTDLRPLMGDRDCREIYPQGKWQFIHSIEFARHGRPGSTLMGVTTLEEDTIRCALLTVEGLTLFEANYSEESGLAVLRAVPPFDSRSFAEGLVQDILLIFRAPASREDQVGTIQGSVPVCRYRDGQGEVTDILPNSDDCWQINRYSSDLRMDRSITASSCVERSDSTIPEYIELRSYGSGAYTLKMTLIRADRLQ